MRQQVDPFWTPPFVLIEMKVQDRLRMLLSPEPSKGPGRPNKTRKLAEIIDAMRKRNCSWQEITNRLNTQFPSEKFNKERVRGIWKRHFGKNSR